MIVVVLAAGAGTRAGGPKALIARARGTWIEEQVDALRGCGAARIVVVASPGLILPPLDAEVVVNPRPEAGQFSSVLLGMAAAGAGPVYILPVDVPCPAAEVWSALAAALPKNLAVIPTYQGRGGHPVLLSTELPLAGFIRLDQALHAGGPVARVPVADPRVVMNLNTPGDFAVI